MKRLEKSIEADIIAALRTLGFSVTKTSQPQHAVGVTKGTPDLYFSHSTWKIRGWCEVKTARGKLSPEQYYWHLKECAAGGTVVVARSVGDVLDELRRLGAPL